MKTSKNLTANDLFNLLLEADQMREDHVLRADLNNSQYLGAFGLDSDTDYGHSSFIINKTQLAVMAGAQIQTEKSPRLLLSARESHRSGEVWMTRQALMTVRALEEAGHISFEEDVYATDEDEDAMSLMGDVAGATPVETQGFVFEMLDEDDEAQAFEVTESFAQRVMPLTQPWQSLIAPEPMTPVLKPEDFIEITDEIAADVLSNNCDILWDKGNNNRWLFENVNYNAIIGWQFGLYQWDDEDYCDKLCNIHLRHVWLPPEATSVEDAEYAVLRDRVSREQAIERYPDIEKQINEFLPRQDEMTVGTQGTDDSGMYPLGGPWANTTFQRAMIDIWTFWVRGKKYPMTIADALKSGRVVRKEDSFYVHNDTGKLEPTAKDAKNWPMKRGVTQYQVCAGVIADERQCPYWDIPLVLNKNVLIPYRWEGQGDPQRLEWIDRLIMKLASCLFDIVRYSRSPQILIPDDFWEALKGQRDEMAARPDRMMHIDAEVYNKYRDILIQGNGFYIKTMPYPEGGMELLQEMLKLHDVLSGNTAELQGRQSGDDMSGVAIQTLQAAARGIVGYKATNTEAMLVRLARLRIDAMMRYMPDYVWKMFNDQYPVEVLTAIKRRAKLVDVDVKVEVSSGAGELRRQEQLQARDDFDKGRISRESLYEKIDVDAKEEMQRMAQQQAEEAAAQPVQAAPPPAQAA